jgi:hypothetical protein
VARAGPSTLSTIQALGAGAGGPAAAADVDPAIIDNAAAAIVNLPPIRIANSLPLFAPHAYRRFGRGSTSSARFTDAWSRNA